MTDIEQKALALLGEVSPYKCEKVDHAHHAYLCAALRLSVERHEAFRQRVSFALKTFKDGNMHTMHDYLLDPFIITKPDPLAEVIKEWWNMDIRENDAETLRALLDARGLEIREKVNDIRF